MVGIKLDVSRFERVESMIRAFAYMLACVEFATPLTDDDLTREDVLVLSVSGQVQSGIGRKRCTGELFHA